LKVQGRNIEQPVIAKLTYIIFALDFQRVLSRQPQMLKIKA